MSTDSATSITPSTGPSAGTTVTAFTHDGSTLIAEERGVPGTGDTFVLLHGIGMGRSIFADLVRRLGPRAHTIAVDLPGYGESPEPPRTPTIERMADTVAALVRTRTRGRTVIVGQSMGTQVAVEVAVRHPDVVDALVLAAPTVNPAERSALRQLLRLGQDLLMENPRVFVIGGREYLRARPHLRRKMRAMLVHRPETSYPRIAAPTLVVRGEYDPVAPPAWCAEVVSTIPDARLVEIEGHGHETLIRDAAPTAAAIREFLSGG